VLVLDYLRTPFSRSRPREPERDAFYPLRGDQLAAMLVREVVKRNNIDPRSIDEVVACCSLPVWEQWSYGGRHVVFLANLPETVPAVFMDKQCGSSMAGIHYGALKIMTGYADLVIVTGYEHMTRVPMGQNPWISTPPDLLTKEEYKHWEMEVGYVMGLTAERLFEEANKKYGITKRDMDEWGLRSHVMAVKALKDGYFKGELLPVEVVYPDGSKRVVDYDLSIRPDTSLEQIEKLPPAFKPGGVITAGNSSPLNAGASAVLLMSKEKVKQFGIDPLAKIIAYGTAGVPPYVMGKGPVPATLKALRKANLKVRDIAFWEINEAFAIVTLYAIHKLGIEPEKVNVKGGAIAIGHPLGATGARLVGTLARILELEGGRYGLATACIGGGQGIATIIERA
jgi:acetyl-CoA C-acetyltransferase